MTPRRRGLALGGGLLLYAVLLLASIAILDSGLAPAGPLRAVVALLPAPAAALIVGLTVAAFAASDELEQRTQLVGLAISFLGTLVLAFSWGLLEGIGLPRVSGFVVFGVLVALYLLGLAWARRQYR